MKNRFLIICTVLFLSSCLAYGQEQASVTNDFSENKQGCIQHPRQGKKVGYIGDSITDPNCYGDNIKEVLGLSERMAGDHSFCLRH